MSDNRRFLTLIQTRLNLRWLLLSAIINPRKVLPSRPFPAKAVTITKRLTDQMRLPAIGAPLFIISTPELVIAQCKAGMVGAFPALNARPSGTLDQWLTRIRTELHDHDQAHPQGRSAPFAVNLIVHRSNTRLQEDLEVCVAHRVPIVITSLGAQEAVNQAVHSYGGVVFHDVINNRFAHKAIEKGADGLIAVAAGAGGHAGTLSPFALVQDIRAWFAGPLALSGAIASGQSLLAAQVMGADFGYIGSAFIATEEANASVAYKECIVASDAADIVYTNLFTGVSGNYLRQSIVAAGLDPDNLPESDPSKMNFGSGGSSAAKAWRDIWGSGQGIGVIKEIASTADLVGRLTQQYVAARSGRACLPPSRSAG